MDALQKLKSKISGEETNDVEYLLDFARELHCLPDIIGRDFEVYDNQNNLLYRVKQKPMKTVQLNTLLKSLYSLRKKEARQMKKKGKR